MGALREFLRADAAIDDVQVGHLRTDEGVRYTPPARLVQIIPAGGATAGPGARSDAMIATMRVDTFMYGETGQDAEMLYHNVQRIMRSITYDSDDMYTAIQSGGPVYRIDGDIERPMIWASWTIDYPTPV